MSEDTLNQRFLYKLFGNTINLFFVVIPYVILPRLLGPVMFGQFFYIKTLFENLFLGLDAGASMCFYTKITKRPNDAQYLQFVGIFIISVLALSLLLTILVCTPLVHSILFPEISNMFIACGLLYGFAFWISEMVGKTMDAYGYTKAGEWLKTTNRILAATIALYLFYIKYASVTLTLAYPAFLLIILIVISVYYLKKQKAPFVFNRLLVNKKQILAYYAEFWKYSKPLFGYSILGFIVLAIDRWLIQHFYGSSEQGLFALVFSIAAISLIFTKSLTPLFTRDIAKLHANKNIKAISVLHEKYIPLFFLISVIIACFLSLNASLIVTSFGGEKYSQAATLLPLMALYPIHQTYGQLNASVYYATDRTKSYCKIGNISLLASTLLSLILILPGKYCGFALGAYGLVVKLLVIQAITSNIYLKQNLNYLRINTKRHFRHQIYLIPACLLIAYVSKLFSFQISHSPIFGLMINLTFYLLCVLALLCLVHRSFGLKTFSTKELISSESTQNA